MGAAGRLQLDQLLTTDATTYQTLWTMIKVDPGKPTLTQLRQLVARLHWLTPYNQGASALANVPSVKVHHFATEAHSLDATRMLRMPLRSTSQDTTVEEALAVLRTHRTKKRDWLDLSPTPLDLSWVSDKWWKLVTGTTVRTRTPSQVQRRHFEVCVFSQVMTELQSGDLCIPGSAQFADYREQLISWEAYHETVAA